jgi:sugar phosphate isomerase/epimerase
MNYDRVRKLNPVRDGTDSEGRTVMIKLSRRDLLASTPWAFAATTSALTATANGTTVPPDPAFRFSLNTSTIRGQKVPLDEEVRIAAQVGYQGIEPWTRELDEFQKSGGSLEELGRRIRDLGLCVIDVIGFAEWAVDDDERRRKGVETLKRDMEMVRKIGGSRIAAPPVGMTDRSDVDYLRFAERYRTILELGEHEGVTPMVEVWGFSKCVHRLGQAAEIAIESGHPSACLLADVYHLYKGGSGFEGLGLLHASALQVFHMNDYPADPPRESIKDEHRVYPGDGIAPWKTIVGRLVSVGFQGWLSLELFNREYWAQDPTLVARTGLQKMKAVIETNQV